MNTFITEMNTFITEMNTFITEMNTFITLGGGIKFGEDWTLTFPERAQTNIFWGNKGP